jgi:hypothetical protein
VRTPDIYSRQQKSRTELRICEKGVDGRENRVGGYESAVSVRENGVGGRQNGVSARENGVRGRENSVESPLKAYVRIELTMTSTEGYHRLMWRATHLQGVRANRTDDDVY